MQQLTNSDFKDLYLEQINNVRMSLDRITFDDKHDMEKLDIIKLLRSFNTTIMNPVERMELLSSLNDIIDNEITVSKSKSKKKSSNTKFLQNLLLNVAQGYFIAIKETREDRTELSDDYDTVLAMACYKSIQTYSHLLMQRYDNYQSEPNGIWVRLNQIYLLAERASILDHQVFGTSISEAYKKIATIRICDPYLLMESEVYYLSDMLDETSNYCSVESCYNNIGHNTFMIDMNGDGVPGNFFPNGKKINNQHRVINISGFRAFVRNKLFEFNQKNGLSLNCRLKLDMLNRVQKQISQSNETREARTPARGEVQLVSGLSACHYYLSDQEEFLPEKEASKIKGCCSSLSNDLSLMPLGQSDYQDNSNIIFDKNPFLSRDMLVQDSWEQINLDTIITTQAMDKFTMPSEHYKEQNWLKKNEHSNGMMLSIDGKPDKNTKVGSLISYFDEKNSQRRQFGLVRWLKYTDNKKTDIGIMKIKGVFTHAAAKAIAGTGSGGKYNQVLLNINPNKNEIIIPSGIYGIGTKLDVLHNKTIKSLQITDISISTSSVMVANYKAI